jgi:serpin B
MVLVNAIHLKLGWANGYAFPPGLTAPGTFTRADATTVTVPMMNETVGLPYVDDGQAQIAALPLVGGSLAVIVALPHGDLATYEAALTAGSAALSQPSGYEIVALTLPKVSFSSPTFSLRKALQNLGMQQAFAMGVADFKGLSTSDPNLYIDDVLQKTELGMMETGVEAAAATAVIVDAASSTSSGPPPPPPVPMIVNRPFLMAIVDVPTGAILFLGHIEDPSAS